MNAFIINLSNVFDFDISMPIVSNLIADKRIWIDNEKSAFPVNPSESLIERKLFAFCNKYEHLRVSLENSHKIESSQLFLVLGYEEWNFLPYGRFLNAYPLFKIKYILEKLSTFFEQPVKALPFRIRIFLTPQKGSERHAFFDSLELDGFLNVENPQWFSTETIENRLSFDLNGCKSLFEKEQANKPINEQIEKEIERHFNIFQAELDKFSSELDVLKTVVDDWKQNYKSRLLSIKTMKQFSEILQAPVPLAQSFLTETFSMLFHAKNLPAIYKYAIDTSTTALGLQTKFEYMQFMLQFVISPFLEDKNKLHKVGAIKINTSALEPMLGKLQGTINYYKKLTVDLEKEVNYNHYTVNESYYRNLPSISAEDRQTFYSLNMVRRTLGFFYNRDKSRAVERNFERNTYSMLENKIPVETGTFTSLLKEALNKQSKTIKVSMIPSEIQRFEDAKLASEIDFHRYATERDKLLREQDIRIEELHKQIPTLPFGLNVISISSIALLLIVAFSIPLFIWENWDNMLMWLPVYISIVLGSVFGAFFLTRRSISLKIRELEAIRISLANNLFLHCEKIKTVAKQMADSFAKRETLKDLNKIKQQYDDQNYRYLAYNNYHKINAQSIDSLARIYSLNIVPTDTSNLQFGYDKHPEDDPNLIQEFPVNDMDLIVNQQQVPCSNMRTIIKKIEIRSY